MSIVFIVNGLGLGNSTRCHAIMEHLIDRGEDIYVITSGNGIWYFENVEGIKDIFEINSFYYGAKDGKLDILSTLGSVGDFFKIARQNNQKIYDILQILKPRLAVIDSIYNFRPLKKAGVPIVAINNSDVVHYSYRKFGDTPDNIRMQFYCIEETDFLYHRTVPDLVLSPILDPSLPNRCKKIKRVGPIVRKGYTPLPLTDTPSNAVIMLSGSVFGSPVQFDKTNYGINIDVIGRPAPDNREPLENITYHGKIKDTSRFLKKADLMVVNGGFSAVSEAFYMRKPVIVVPVPNHAEQWLNARTIQNLGVGEIATEENFVDVMEKMLKNLAPYRQSYSLLPDIPDGARQSADEITSFANTL